uniref:Uncharacterized protein n=1 Tax=Gopherus agassizii TaxID=38772 RepID=A0A452IJA1_9SAUR
LCTFLLITSFAFILPWHSQDVSANPRAHVAHAGRTKSRYWWATQPGCHCRIARGAWSCVGDTEQLCLLSLLPHKACWGLGAAVWSWALQPCAGRSKQKALEGAARPLQPGHNHLHSPHANPSLKWL